MTEIAGRLIVITGGARGIGRATADRLVKLGGRVVLWDIDGDAAAATAEEIGAVEGSRCDVASATNVAENARDLRSRLGDPDIVINNAGIVSGKRILEGTDDEIQRTFAVNALSLFWTARGFLPAMIERGSGHICTIASAAGTVGVAGLTDYCASKWAAVGFDESLRMELRTAAPDVKTSVVCPYYVDTGMFDGVRSRWSSLLPILPESKVADAIVEAITRDRARVFLPRVVGLLPALRLLPTSAFDLATDALGINRSMDEFRGRGD